MADSLAPGRVGVPGVVGFVLSAATPITVVAGVVVTGFAVTGVTGIPLAFVGLGVILGLFAVGFVAMAQRIPHSGAFYAFVTHGLGRHLGVAAAWLALLSYNFLQVGLYGMIGAAAQPLLNDWVGVAPPWWVIALPAWLLVAVFGVLRVDVNERLVMVLLAAEILGIVVADIGNLTHPAAGVTFTGFAPASLAQTGCGAVLGLGLLGFVGFESGAVFAEESKDPRRTIRYATYTAITLMAVLYALSAWSLTVATGPDQIVTQSREQGPDLLFALTATHLGGTSADILHVLFVTSLIAAMISFHGTTARYAFALGREGVLPGRFGRTSRAGAPTAGSVAQSLLALTVIVVYAVAGWDPVIDLFFLAGTSGGYGVLLLITLTAVAVLAYFGRHPHGENRWRRRIAPGLALTALAVVTALATANFDVLLGVSADSPLRWVVPAGYLTAALTGVGWAAVLKTTRPDAYTRIGLGAKAATAALHTTTPTEVPAR